MYSLLRKRSWRKNTNSSIIVMPPEDEASFMKLFVLFSDWVESVPAGSRTMAD
jgi:hypothetical protein